MKFLTLLIAILVTLINSTARADRNCVDCGCECARPICRLKCDTTKIPKVTFSCKCEDYCITGPAKQRGCTCETGDCGHKHCKPNMVPQWAKIYTRNKLYKHVEMKEERKYTWVVEYVCDDCAHDCVQRLDSQPSDPSSENQSTEAQSSQDKQTSHLTETIIQSPSSPTPIKKVSFLDHFFLKNRASRFVGK